jgi:hypothetical protein
MKTKATVKENRSEATAEQDAEPDREQDGELCVTFFAAAGHHE